MCACVSLPGYLSFLFVVVFEKLVNRVLINVIIGSWIQCATATKSAADTAIVATTRPSILRRKQKRMISSMQTRGSVYLCRKKIILAAKRLVFIFHWRCCNYLALFLNLREAWDEIDWMWFERNILSNMRNVERLLKWSHEPWWALP